MQKTYLKMLILIFPSSRCHMPCMRRPHCRPKAARSKLMPTLLNPYLLRKVIRNPKPMKIMTCTSWNTADIRKEVSYADDSVWGHRSVMKVSLKLEVNVDVKLILMKLNDLMSTGLHRSRFLLQEQYCQLEKRFCHTVNRILGKKTFPV